MSKVYRQIKSSQASPSDYDEFNEQHSPIRVQYRSQIYCNHKVVSTDVLLFSYSESIAPTINAYDMDLSVHGWTSGVFQ